MILGKRNQSDCFELHWENLVDIGKAKHLHVSSYAIRAIALVPWCVFGLQSAA